MATRKTKKRTSKPKPKPEPTKENPEEFQIGVTMRFDQAAHQAMTDENEALRQLVRTMAIEQADLRAELAIARSRRFSTHKWMWDSAAAPGGKGSPDGK